MGWAQIHRWSLWLGFGPDWICLNDRPWTESGFRRPPQWLKASTAQGGLDIFASGWTIHGDRADESLGGIIGRGCAPVDSAVPVRGGDFCKGRIGAGMPEDGEN